MPAADSCTHLPQPAKPEARHEGAFDAFDLAVQRLARVLRQPLWVFIRRSAVLVTSSGAAFGEKESTRFEHEQRDGCLVRSCRNASDAKITFVLVLSCLFDC